MTAVSLPLSRAESRDPDEVSSKLSRRDPRLSLGMTSRRVEPRPILAETGRAIMATISSARPSWQRGRVFTFFASLKLAVVLLAVLIVAAIAGTIWESSFDPNVARAYVCRAPWFNPLAICIGYNLILL